VSSLARDAAPSAPAVADLNERSNLARAGAAAAWLAPLAAGALLRLWNLPRQILLDDEMHTVATALYVPVREIVSSWKSEDPCLPLAALLRLLLESGLRFSEMTFRAPVLIASLATIVLLPLLALPLVGRRIAIVYAWLLAVSPVLAIYGGMVRPYGVIALLAPAAVLAVLRWRDSGRLRWGVVWAVLAPLCLWFHLATAPMLVTPMGLFAFEALSKRRARVGRDIAIAATIAALLIAAFLAPTWKSLRELFSAKSGIAPFSFELIPPIARLEAGAANGPAMNAVTLLFWAVAAAGCATLVRRRPAHALYPLLSTLALWVGLAVLAPIGLLNPIIFNRYLIGTLPLVLLAVAIGLVAIGERIATAAGTRQAALRPRLGWAGPAAFLVVLLLAGPFADPVFRRSSFQHNKDFLRFDLPRGEMPFDVVPAFYRELGRAAGRDDASDGAERLAAGPVAELPFRGGWAATRAHYVYQSLHGEPVLAVEPYEWTCDPRLRLRNHLCPHPAELLASEARYLVVHRDPLAEEETIIGGDDTGNRYQPEQWAETKRVAARLIRGLRRRWGPPLLHDDRVTVWDLERVRRRASERRGSSSRGAGESGRTVR